MTVEAMDIRSHTALELSSSLIRAKAAVNGVVILTIWNFGTLQIAIGELELDHIVQLKAAPGVID